MTINQTPAEAGQRAVTAPGRWGTVPRRTTGMRARACVATTLHNAADGSANSRLSTLRSEPPLLLRVTMAKEPEPWAAHAPAVPRVSVAAGAGGPVGGDQLTLHVDVGRSSSLVLAEVSPTLLLPGPHGQRSRMRVRIRVATGATLIWLPEPIIAARGCDHLNDVRVDLDDGARFFMREELLLGRHGEHTGQLTQRVNVRLCGRPLYRQDLGIGTPGADSPAVIGRHRAVGSALIIDPSWSDHPPQAQPLTGDAALLPLNGPAVLITTLGDDNLKVRADLQHGLATLGEPWDPTALPDR